MDFRFSEEQEELGAIARSFLAEASDPETVRQVMTTDLVTVPRGMNIYFAAGIFLANRFRRLPVVDDGKLVGAITRFDILRAIRDQNQPA